MRSLSPLTRQVGRMGVAVALLGAFLVAPQAAAQTPICESRTLPDGSTVVCFLSGSNVTWRVPDNVTSVEYLVVAGGGGGGADNAGGGGAGGMLTGTTSVTPGNELVVTVGSGGAAGTGTFANSTRGGSGGDSSLRIQTDLGERVIAQATGGGGGGAGIGTGAADQHPGLPGGSGGGGAGEANGADPTGGSGVPGQGNKGGDGVKLGNGGGGGGGGAGAPGRNGDGTKGGDGGDGRSTTITGRTLTFAGGGGGAANLSTQPVDDQGKGGAGGGGAAGNPGTSGAANTGGGGGGGSWNGINPGTADAGAGGTGIVVLRYSVNVPPVPVYTLTIESNDGACSVGRLTGNANTWVNLPPASACTRDDYEFVGFNVSPDGNGLGFAPGAPIYLTGDNTVYAIWSKIEPTPFDCSADLYQVSGTGGGVLYVYDPSRNTMDLVPAGGGPSRASGANATGYNPVDDFIYGIAPNGSARHLWKFGSNGVYEDLGPILLETTGQPVTNLSLISGDFVDNDVLLAIQIPSTILTIDVAPTRSGLPAVATQQRVPADVWGAADIAFTADRTVGYGMGNNILYIVNLPGAGSADQLTAALTRGSYSRKTVQGVPLRATYGASYLDQNNNAYFYNNEQRRIYLVTADELSKAQPTAVPLGTERAFVLGTEQTLQTPTDGASCSTAPIVTVTLSYRINGGTGTTPVDQVGFVDQSVTVADGIGFQRDGFTFAGWNTVRDGSGTSYPPGALFALGDSGGVLFAEWKPVEPAPVVPPENTLDPIVEPTPSEEDDQDRVIFTPIKDLPAPPSDPWNPSSVVLVNPDTGDQTPVVQNDSGDWSVNNRTGDVSYVPEPTFSGAAQIAVQLETVSGVRYETKLRTSVPSCQRGMSVRTTVYFDVLSAKLSPASQRKLDRLVRSAERAGIPTCTAVVGYVQPTVNRSNDISLSTARATSVAKYLETRGVSRIIRTEGLGRADEQGAKARRATARIYLVQAPDPEPLD